MLSERNGKIIKSQLTTKCSTLPEKPSVGMLACYRKDVRFSLGGPKNNKLARTNSQCCNLSLIIEPLQKNNNCFDFPSPFNSTVEVGSYSPLSKIKS